MTNLMYVLYEYVCKKELSKQLDPCEYDEVQTAIKKQKANLKNRFSGLDEPLDSLLEELSLSHSLELEAMFEATISLCAQLDRLTTGPY